MVTITSHIFIDIFQTVHFSAVKFNRGNVKNMSSLNVIPKSLKVWKKTEEIGPGSFKTTLNALDPPTTPYNLFPLKYHTKLHSKLHCPNLNKELINGRPE